MRGLFKKGNIEKEQCNYGKAKSNGCFGIDIFDVELVAFHNAFASFLSTNAPDNATIPNKILAVNNRKFGFGLLETNGTIITAPNQPAERLTKRSDNVISQVGSTFSTNGNLAEVGYGVNQIFRKSKALSLSISLGVNFVGGERWDDYY